MTQAITELLRKTPLFAGVSEAALAEIARASREETFDEGDRVYELGDDAEAIYIVAKGRVRFSIGVGNRAGTDSVMGPGQVFGWAALIDERPRRVATADCLEPCTIAVIPAKALLMIFDKDRASGYLVMRRLAGLIARDFLSALAV
ncbi:MAG: cyclic nucleotide-binding domain-containing protein [Alphaproteobacteria bacterium]|nr:cyclic nucleotide-binding domain-containing protein [Alphaproteobacteria bacterium]MBM3949843.1 cyclic nucleotide-binding domain-containing protein [Rhodospirillales bacterium]